MQDRHRKFIFILIAVAALIASAAMAQKVAALGSQPTVTDNAPSSWKASAVTLTLSPVDNGGSGIAKTQYRPSGSSDWLDTNANRFVVAAPADHSNDGAQNYEYRAVDNSGLVSDTGTCTVRIDTSGPTVTDNAPADWNTSAVTVTLSPVDSGSGIYKTQYRLSGDPTWIDTSTNELVVAAPADHSNDGAHRYYYRAVDNVGLTSDAGTCKVRIDTAGPTVTDNAPPGWNTTAVAVTLTAADSGSGVAKIQYRLSGSSDWRDTSKKRFIVTAPADHSNDGVNTYEYRAIDNLGNVGDTGTCAVRIDTTGPAVTSDAPTGWSKTAVTVTLNAIDSGSGGVAKTQYRRSGSPTWLDTNSNQFVVAAPASHSNDGANKYECRAIDDLGNASDASICTVKIDTSGPAVTDNAPDGWNKTAVTVILGAADSGSGVVKTQYRPSGSSTWLDANADRFVVAAPADHSNDGVHHYQYRALDELGLVSNIGTCAVKIDTTGPTVTDNAPDGWKKTKVVVTLHAASGNDGIAKTQYRLAGTSTWLKANAKKFVVFAPANHGNDGVHSYQYRAFDKKGKASNTGICTTKIDTSGPLTFGKAASGKKGCAMSLKYRITDKLSPQAKAIKLTIKNAKGKIVKSIKLGTKATRKWLSVAWTPKAKGSYRYSISARDLAGNKQAKAPKAKITVK